jgi:hypothetical protein
MADFPRAQRRAVLEAEVCGTYPDLRVREAEDGCIVVRGGFPIMHEDELLDHYSVEIRIPPKFPDEVPIVIELDGRIPATGDRHAFKAGNLCVEVPEDWLLRRDRSLLAYLNGPLREYFIADALVALGEERPFPARPHNSAGLLEAYGEMLETTDPLATRRYLDTLSHKKIRGHWPCPCGSGRKLRDCHGAEVRALQARIPRRITRSALARLKYYERLDAESDAAK